MATDSGWKRNSKDLFNTHHLNKVLLIDYFSAYLSFQRKLESSGGEKGNGFWPAPE
jgi:hypothetical protein